MIRFLFFYILSGIIPILFYTQTRHMSVKALNNNFNCNNDFHFCPGISWSLEVHQSPPDLIANPGYEAEIQCSHDRTDYRLMLWYQRPLGSMALKLIGYLNYDRVQMESSYSKNFTLSGDLTVNTRKEGKLMVRVSATEQCGEYLCAASSARHPKIPSECYKNFTPHSQTPAATAAPVWYQASAISCSLEENPDKHNFHPSISLTTVSCSHWIFCHIWGGIWNSLHICTSHFFF